MLPTSLPRRGSRMLGRTSAWRCVVGGVSAKPHVQLLVSKEGFLSLEKCINRKWVSQNLIPLMVVAVVGWWRHRRSNPSARCSNPRLRGFQLSFVTACHATTLQYLASSPLSWKGSLTSSNSTSRASLLAFDSQTLEDTWRIYWFKDDILLPLRLGKMFFTFSVVSLYFYLMEMHFSILKIIS